ncbi:puff II/9-2 protein-like [Drosophila busckii]|uniref:puff II/9-2 protein-like n=1 Tax=Drosophila busckii TaxID=30019 RepID=UPI00143336E9|nr:puff II/9-2 protein-like [Drosophila busckii]
MLKYLLLVSLLPLCFAMSLEDKGPCQDEPSQNLTLVCAEANSKIIKSLLNHVADLTLKFKMQEQELNELKNKLQVRRNATHCENELDMCFEQLANKNKIILEELHNKTDEFIKESNCVQNIDTNLSLEAALNEISKCKKNIADANLSWEAKQTINNSFNAIVALRNELKTCEENVEIQLNVYAEIMKKTADELEQQVTRTNLQQAALSTLNATLSECKNLTANLESDVAKNRELSTSVDSLNAQVSILNQKVSECASSWEKCESNSNNKDAEISDLNQRINDKDQEVSRSNQRANNWWSDWVSCKRSANDKDYEILSLNSQINRLSSSNESWKSSANNKDEEISSLNQRVNNLSSSLDNCNGNANNKERECDREKSSLRHRGDCYKKKYKHCKHRCY